MKKILVVDDSETLRNQIKGVLEKSGYSVVEGEDGLTGLARLKENSDVSLILCDVNMPNMNGLSMIEEVHKLPDYNKIPIFMLTTEANSEIKKKAKESGVIAWIVKPFVEATMLAAIKKVLGV